MGYNIFETVNLKQSFRKKLKSFVATLGSAITKGNKISFADNDISYVSNEQYNIRRKITRDGKKLFEDNKRISMYATITDVISGVHPDDEVCSCPNCGSVSTIARLQAGCPFCGTRYKMSDLFPKVTGYYFIEDVSLAGDEGKRIMRKFMIGAVIAILLFALIVEFFVFKDQHARGEEFNFGLLLAPLFLIPIGIAVGYFAYSFYLIFRTIAVGSRQSAGKWGAIGLADFKEEDGRVIVSTDAFFDVLYDTDGKIRSRKEKYRAVFIRRTDIPIDMRFSMTKIQCPTCGGSFNAVQNRICPFCGRSYDIESQDWILSKLYRE